jgi:hypothetical protein
MLCRLAVGSRINIKHYILGACSCPVEQEQCLASSPQAPAKWPRDLIAWRFWILCQALFSGLSEASLPSKTGQACGTNLDDSCSLATPKFTISGAQRILWFMNEASSRLIHSHSTSPTTTLHDLISTTKLVSCSLISHYNSATAELQSVYDSIQMLSVHFHVGSIAAGSIHGR